MDKTLYFGTDARYWVLPQKYRELFRESCRMIIQDLYPKFNEYHQRKDNCFGDLFDDDIYSSHSKLLNDLSDCMLDARMVCIFQDNGNYKVTNVRLVACANALDSYGGAPHAKTAYLMIKAADLLGWADWEEDSIMKTAKKFITTLVETDSSPVLFTFSKIDEELWNHSDQSICAFQKRVSEDDIIHLISSNNDLHSPEMVDKDFNLELKKDNNHIPYLYHGTDARIIKMTEEERNNYINICHAVVNYLWSFFKPLFQERKLEHYKDMLSPKDNPNLYANVYEKLSMVDMMNNGCQQYQYGDLYLTSCGFSAANYSRRSFAGGEIGLIAYRMIEAAETIGFDGLYKNNTAVYDIKTVKQFALEESEPIVIKVRDIDPLLLQEDTGETIDWSSIKVIPQLFRYSKEMILDMKDAVNLENVSF